jgi:CRP-like cAMP-binding protein
MATSDTSAGYIVWGIDHVPYGPVELPTLVSWIKDDRVTADTWIYRPKDLLWKKASELPELQMFFRTSAKSATPDSTVRGISPGSLRRIKILAAMSEEQLERFASFVEVENAPQWTVIVQQGEPGDSMYFILSGELRVRIMVMDRETILTTLSPGDFFGDISLLDKGPRSADVVANVDSILLKVTAGHLEEISKQAPDLAAVFLKGLGRTLTARIRADNKRLGDSIKFSRAAE